MGTDFHRCTVEFCGKYLTNDKTLLCIGQELASCRQGFGYTDLDVALQTVLLLLLGSTIAFLMEFAEFLVVSYTSSLTLSLASVIKVHILIGVGLMVYWLLQVQSWCMMVQVGIR